MKYPSYAQKLLLLTLSLASALAVGAWRVEARPVRASAESCIECHRRHSGFEIKTMPATGGAAVAAEKPKEADLKVGDPLGVLLYAYRKGD